MHLYKRLKTFYNNQYKFVLDFTKDLEYEQINIFNNNINWNRVKSNLKYFYYDVESANKLYHYSFGLIEKHPQNIGKAFEIIMDSLEKGIYTENNLFLYKDTEKLNGFKSVLQYLKGILDYFIMIIDFDETGLVFSFGEKEDEISKIIDNIISIIDSSPDKPIDTLIDNLHSSLTWFSNTVQYSLNFIKFRINNYFEEYLENN